MTRAKPQTESLPTPTARRAYDRIIAAVVALVSEAGHSDFTMPEVATASEMSLRTVYRYFPTRQTLVDAVAKVGDQAAASNLPSADFDLNTLGVWLAQAWRNLMSQEAFIRAQHTSPNGAAIRRARIPFFRDISRELVQRAAPELTGADLEDAVDTALILSSSATMFEFIDVLEVDIDRAAKLAAEATIAVIQSKRRR